MDVPVKPQASIHAFTLYTALTLRTSVTGDQRLAFTGTHFGDFAAVEDDAADQLHVEVAHVEEAAAGFADHGEGFDEQVVEGRALGQFFLEFDGFGGQVDIGELLDGRFQVVDCGDDGLDGLDFALVFGAKNLGQNGVDHREVSLQKEIRCYYSSAGGGEGRIMKLRFHMSLEQAILEAVRALPVEKQQEILSHAARLRA